jgi:hypothetical protein
MRWKLPMSRPQIGQIRKSQETHGMSSIIPKEIEKAEQDL